jgi:hypothetical protein
MAVGMPGPDWASRFEHVKRHLAHPGSAERQRSNGHHLARDWPGPVPGAAHPAISSQFTHAG